MAELPETRISLILRLAEPADVQAWEEFAAVYGPALYRLALRRGLQSADAEDVAQEILFAVARAIERFEPDQQRARFRTWLSRIARNLLADFCAGRAKRPLTQLVSDSWLREASVVACDDGALDAFDHEFKCALFQFAANRVRERVSADTWSAFEGTAVQGRASEQVAAELAVPVGNVYVARCRVLKMLRVEVEQLERSFAEDLKLELPSVGESRKSAEVQDE
jgi:RNA polymerase sigma-70 factor (ECF subfamily)